MRYPTLRVIASLLAIAALGISAGCVTKTKFDTTQQERDDLAAIAAKQDAELDAMQKDYDNLAELFETELEQKELQIRKLVDGIEVEIPSDVMYKSGSATASVGSEGLDNAKTLAEYLAGTDYFISVVGHTDSQQPTPRLAERFPTNWHLAAARASNVVNFLASNGCNPETIVAVSKGEFSPVASNDTPEGRAQNRRIQIIIRELPE